MVVEAINRRVASLLGRLSEASSVPKEVVLEEALKLWAAARELDVEGPRNDEEPLSCDVAYPLGSSEVYCSHISMYTVAHRRDNVYCSDGLSCCVP